MTATRLPKLRWTMEAACPGCARNSALAIYLAGGKMPKAGAVRLKAQCRDCGHTWELPQEGATRTSDGGAGED